MKRIKHRLWAAGLMALLVRAETASASDHIDSPAGGSDPSGDITDLFAFKNPAGDKLVLVLNTVTSAPKTARFSDQITYSFRVRPDAKDANQELRIDCVFDAEETQHGQCTAYVFDPTTKKLTKIMRGSRFDVSDTSETGGANPQRVLRVFAGPRRDPFYLDVPGIGSSIMGGAWVFPEGNVNSLENMNVLSIVVEFDVARFLDLPSSQIIRVAAETTVGAAEVSQ